MSQVISFGALDARVENPKPHADSPFRIAVLGDFSGRVNQGKKSTTEKLKNRKARKIDRENFDSVMGKFKPKLTLTLPKLDEPIELSVPALDDFEPDELVMMIDAFADCESGYAKTLLMNDLLHHPDTQALEGGWRSVDWLLKRVAKRDYNVDVVLYNISFEEFCEDLTGSDDLAQTAMYHLLVEKIAEDPKGEPWGLFVGNYQFDITPQHAEVLGRMAKIAKAAGVAFFANADPRLTSKSATIDNEAEEQWSALRQLPEASYLGLAAPRFLVRAPYGEATRAVERFRYEEFTDPKDNCYLWGGGAFACAGLLGSSFGGKGWAFVPGEHLDLHEMAMHVWRDEDDDEHMTLAETWLKKNSTERLASLGIMPLLCVKNRNAMQLLRFQSLAQPPKGQVSVSLTGRWGQPNLAKPGAAPPPSASAVIGGPGEAPTPSVGSSQGSIPQPPVQDGLAPAEPTPGNDQPPTDGPAAQEDDMDPELAAMLADMDSAGESAPTTESEPEDEMDPELAALLADMDSPPEQAADPEPEEEEMDPELAALLADLDTPNEESTEPPEDEEDPELAALLADLEGGDEPGNEPTAQEDEEEDPELAALLAGLENDEQTEETETATDKTTGEDDEEDPELAALLAGLESNEDEPEGEEATATEPTLEPPPQEDEEEDPELAALLAGLEDDEQTEDTKDDTTLDDTTAVQESADEQEDPELAALLASLEGGDDDDQADTEETETATDEVSAEGAEEDPELAALLASLESDEDEPEGEEATATEPTLEPTPQEDEEEDPELAALLAGIEDDEEDDEEPETATDDTEPADLVDTQEPTEEQDDPELAALLAGLEDDEDEADVQTEDSSGEGEDAEEDPELAALLAGLEDDEEPDDEEVTVPDLPPETIAGDEDDEDDPELAALLAGLEDDEDEAEEDTDDNAQATVNTQEEPEDFQEDQEAESQPHAEDSPVPQSNNEQDEQVRPSPESETTDGPTVESPTESPDPEPIAAPTTEMLPTDLAAEIQSLGGRTTLEDLGWPTFVPGFAEDLPRQLAILRNGTKHSAAEQEVQMLIRECGGYDALGNFGVTAEQGLRTQIAGLRQIRKDMERVRALTDGQLQSLARSYGADLDDRRTDEEKIDVLLKAREYHEWATRPKNAEIAGTLQDAPFSAKRRAQLENQLNALGGAAAYYEWITAHPQDEQPEATLEAEVVLLQMVKQYNDLGGDEAYQAKAAGTTSRPETLSNKLEQLKAALALD
ncbi:MAG: type VI secretion system contractile sheath domain-containing protein [Gemmataceae bacterium]